MRPGAHVAVALPPVVAYVLVRDGRLPTWRLVDVVFVGSLVPDFVD